MPRPLLLVIVVLALVGPACGGGDGGTGPSPATPAGLRLVTPPGSVARNHALMAQQPVVQVVGRDGRGTPKAGIEVTVSVHSGGGTVSGTLSVVSDETGRAQFHDLVLAGPVGPRRLRFSAPGLDSTVSQTIELLAGAAAILEVRNGRGQVGIPAGTPVPVVPLVRVSDIDRNPVAGEVVAFRTLDGGSVEVSQRFTTPQGEANPGNWYAGGQVGTQRLEVRVPAVAGLADTIGAGVRAGPPSVMTVLAGAQQAVPAGTPVPIPPSIRLQDQFGNPVSGLGVEFTTSSGALTGHLQTTDSLGIATVGSWTVSTVAGATALGVRLAAPPYSPLGSVGATVTPGPIAAILLWQIGFDTLHAPTGYPLPTPEFALRDQYGNPINGSVISFSASDGVLDSAVATTSAPAGAATAGLWRLGAVAGLQSLTASAGGLQAVLWVATHPGRMLTKVAGDSQSVEVGTPIPVDPVVRVTDSLGAPVPGVPVTFSLVGQFSGTYAGAEVVPTDSSGEARASGWTVGTARLLGSTLLAAATGLAGAPAAFVAVLRAGPPVGWAYAFGPVTGMVNQVTPEPPILGVRDQYGNGVPGQPLEWTLTAGGGALLAADSVTDSLGGGRATWRLGTRAGLNRLILKTPAVPGDSITYTTQGLAGPVDTLVVIAGEGQVGAVRRALPIPPEFEVQDPYQNRMASIPVSFTVTGGGGMLAAPSAVTDVGGRASPGVWTLGSARGTQTIRAQVTGPSGPIQVDLVATAVQPPAAAIATTGGSGQSVRAGAPSPVPVAVQVQDSAGFGIEGDTVRFTVTGGGGTLPATFAVTDTGGIARLAGWTLGAGSNTLAATHDALPGQSVGFSASGVAASSSWDITLQPIAPLASPVQAAFDAAAARWRSIIVGDVPDVTVSLPANSCFTGQPAFNGTVDDLHIFVLVTPIDGAGGILGGTGICAQRAGTALPSVAAIILDATDLQVSAGFTPAIVLHEVGHALGIGAIWADRSLLLGAGGASPRYLGAGAKLGYWAIRGATGTVVTNVPVEGNQSPAGSRDVHWEETAFNTELMTPYLDSAVEPLSLLTAASLVDLGYVVDLAAADANFAVVRAGPAPGPRLAPGWELLFPGPIPPGVIPVAPSGP